MTELFTLVDSLGSLVDGNTAWDMVFCVLATVTEGETSPVVSNQARNQISGFSVNPLIDSFRANALLWL